MCWRQIVQVRVVLRTLGKLFMNSITIVTKSNVSGFWIPQAKSYSYKLKTETVFYMAFTSEPSSLQWAGQFLMASTGILSWFRDNDLRAQDYNISFSDCFQKQQFYRRKLSCSSTVDSIICYGRTLKKIASQMILLWAHGPILKFLNISAESRIMEK